MNELSVGQFHTLLSLISFPMDWNHSRDHKIS